MGMEFRNLTCEELCDLMCGGPEPEYEEDDDDTRGSSGDLGEEGISGNGDRWGGQDMHV